LYFVQLRKEEATTRRWIPGAYSTPMGRFRRVQNISVYMWTVRITRKGLQKMAC